MSLSIEKNILDFNRKSIIFRRLVKNKEFSLIQDNNGNVYTISGSVENTLNEFIENNDFEIVNEIKENKIPPTQSSISDVKESLVLKNDFERGDKPETTVMVEIPVPEEFINVPVLLSPNKNRTPVNGYVSTGTLFNDFNIDPRLDQYYPLNSLNIKNRTLNIAKRYTYVHAEEIEKLFISEKNKTIMFLSTRGGLSVVNDDMSNFSFSDEELTRIFYYFRMAQDHCSLEIEKLENGEYTISAVYEKFSFYSWAKIERNDFKKFQINL